MTEETGCHWFCHRVDYVRSLVNKSPAAEKALSASTLVGGIDFNVERIFSIAGGSLPVASKL